MQTPADRLRLSEQEPAPPAPQVPVAALWQHPLGLLLDSTGEGIFGVDLEGHCTFINRAGAQMLGWPVDEVLGRNMHRLTHHSHADGACYADADCPIFNAFRRGLPCRIDTEVFWRRDGTSFAVEYSSHPILDGDAVRGAVVAFVDITERKRVAEALRQSRDELEARVAERTTELSAALQQVRELSAWMDSVREEERTRIAREVHDELGSLLVALKMEVNWIGRRLGEQQDRAPDEAQAMREQMRGKCSHMSRLIEHAVANVGRIITDLRPSILDHQGLWAALEWQAHEFARSAELGLDWRMDVDESLELPEPAAMALFRIFQEMLSNIGRHAHARHVAVCIGVQGAELCLRVQDDGMGAPAQAFHAPNAYGVRGMRERALHFGGRIEVRSEVGQGTELRLFLPLALPH